MSETATFSVGDNLARLDGQGRSGDIIHQSQVMAKNDGFGKVSKIWFDKTISFEQGLELIAKEKAETNDILATIDEMRPAVGDDGFVMRHRDGLDFRLTDHACEQMGHWAGCGSWFVKNLLNNPKDSKENELFSRDRGDSETLARVFNNGLRRVDPEKKFLWRIREGTVRAILTERYATVDNEWLIEAIRKLIPNGRLSHWRGNSDTIFGNVLIPDSIREEEDSDYGGMLSIGNSEIGERSISSCPSIFRAICMNGCIWDRTEGQRIRQVHRGNIDLDKLFMTIRDNLQMQIPLLPQGIEKLLGTKKMGWDGASIKPLFAQVSIDAKLSRKQATSLLAAYNDERLTTPQHASTLFSVANSVTRAGQQMGNAEWVKMDELGGRLASYASSDWDRLVTRAKGLKAKEVDEVFVTN